MGSAPTAVFSEYQTEETIALILKEGERARAKHGTGGPFATPSRFLEILVEEVGEVAKAINEKDYEGLRKEAAQVASVALRWLAGDLQGSSKP